MRTTCNEPDGNVPERTLHIVGRLMPKFPHHPDDTTLGYAKPYGLIKQGRRYVLLSLDTKRDTLVAESFSLLGCCGGGGIIDCYYLHRDESGQEYFYKTGISTFRLTTPRMMERINRYLQNVKFDVSDDAAVECATKAMLVDLRSRPIAERLCGVCMMSREAVLRDFARLGGWTRIVIHDEGLEREHYPRPTVRGFGGYPSQLGLALQDAEKKLYWSRLEKGEPIPPVIWRFLEDMRNGRVDLEHPVLQQMRAEQKDPAAVPDEQA